MCASSPNPTSSRKRTPPCCRAWSVWMTASAPCSGRNCSRAPGNSFQSGRPFLGICVGYQALFEKSEEFNSCAAGFGLFSGNVVKFPKPARTQSPANRLESDRDRPLQLPAFLRHPRPQLHVFRPQLFSAAGRRRNRGDTHRLRRPFCVSDFWREQTCSQPQFHPEKSQTVGLTLLKNFVDLAKA